MWTKVDTADNHITQTEADLCNTLSVLSVRTVELWGFCFKDQVLVTCLFFCTFYFPLIFGFPTILFCVLGKSLSNSSLFSIHLDLFSRFETQGLVYNWTDINENIFTWADPVGESSRSWAQLWWEPS